MSPSQHPGGHARAPPTRKCDRTGAVLTEGVHPWGLSERSLTWRRQSGLLKVEIVVRVTPK